MDPDSGTFTAPLNGAYLMSVTVCSHDHKKVLIAIRRNGQEIASLYDQVHTLYSTIMLIAVNFDKYCITDYSEPR